MKRLAADISVILNAHHEGWLMHASVRSAAAAIQAARQDGHTAELVVVLDSPDTDTERYVAETLPSVVGAIPHVIDTVAVRDVSLARNHGITLAKGTYVAIFAADDLFSRNILSAALRFLRAHPQAVAHPEYVVSFGDHSSVWRAPDSTDPAFQPAAAVEYNPWPTCIAARDIFIQTPFVASKAGGGFGPEDWHWNLETLASGHEHLHVPGTTYFYRRKPAEHSLLARHAQQHILPPTALLRPSQLDAYLARRSVPHVAIEPSLITGKAVKRPIKSVALQAFRAVGRTAHRIVQPLLAMHPRLRHFDAQMAQAARELLRPPRPAPAPAVVAQLPDWVIDEWRAMHAFDHALYPSEHLLQHLPIYEPHGETYTDIYWRLARQLPDRTDYIFLVPWLKQGGADLVTLHYIQAILTSKPEAKVAVIATEPAVSPWQERLPPGVAFIALEDGFHALSFTDQTRLLATVLVQARPQVIHLINSALGYRLLTEYAVPLQAISHLFISVFSVDYTREGQRAHYILDHLDYSFRQVEKILADNQHIIDDLVGWKAYPREKFQVHYQPYDGGLRAPHKTRRISPEAPLRVLWAGRLDGSKRLDVLLHVADMAYQRKLPIHFTVAGNFVLDAGSALTAQVQLRPNMEYHGGYDKGLLSLPLGRYDLFMMTTQYEGLPNVLLEATAGGLPILAPAVGGIPEFVRAGNTGCLVEHFDDIGAYVAALEDIINRPQQLAPYVQNAQDLIRSRHSWQVFIDQLKTDGYITTKSRRPPRYNKIHHRKV